MQEVNYLGIKILYSITGKYRIEVTPNGKSHFPAVILRKVRSYWEQIDHGVNMRQEDLDKYLKELV